MLGIVAGWGVMAAAFAFNPVWYVKPPGSLRAAVAMAAVALAASIALAGCRYHPYPAKRLIYTRKK